MKIRQDPSKPVKIYDDRDETRKSVKTCENPRKPRENPSKPVKFPDDRDETRKSVKIRENSAKFVKTR